MTASASSDLRKPLVELEDSIVPFDDYLAWTLCFRSLASLDDRMGLGYEDTEQAGRTELLHTPPTFDLLDEESAACHLA
jgi:hypothetical protein